jgi:hypothetical protein
MIMKKGKEILLAASNVTIAVVVAVVFGLTVHGCSITKYAQIKLSSIQITPSDVSIVSGATLTLTAMGVYSDASTKDLTNSVTWGSSNEDIATFKSAPGVVTAMTLTSNHCTITATGSDGVAATMTLTVMSVEDAVSSIVVTVPDNPIAQYFMAQFKATGHMKDGSTMDLTSMATWTSSAPDVLDILSAGSTTPGLATAKTAGMADVTASIGAKNGTLTNVEVTPNPPLSIEVQTASSAITSTLFVNPGGTVQLAAIATFAGSITHDVTTQATWTSSAPDKVSISPSGLASGLAPGSSMINATLDTAVSDDVAVEVNNVQVISVAVTVANGSSATVDQGATLQLKATATYDDLSTADVTNSATWSSNSPNATVDSTGKVTGVTASGTPVNITAESQGQSGSLPVTVTVPAVSLQSITFSNTDNYGDWGIGGNQTVSIIATGHYSDGSTKDITTEVTWASSNTAVATVDSAGVATGMEIGATTDVTISATLGNVTGYVVLTVYLTVGHS